MKYLVGLLMATLLCAGAACAQASRVDTPCATLNENVAGLIREYKDLAERRRLLPPGTFDNEVSGSGGRLGKVLSALGVELGHRPYTDKIITGCLGKPDAIRSHPEMRGLLEIYNRELRQAGRKVVEHPKRKYLIYFWRGWHDFLFFISEDGVIVDHGWWFAYE